MLICYCCLTILNYSDDLIPNLNETMNNEAEKPEFWESAFIEKQEMWGFEPSNSAVFEITEISENYPFFLIKCRKGGNCWI